jgi:hypothetical protein
MTLQRQPERPRDVAGYLGLTWDETPTAQETGAPGDTES